MKIPKSALRVCIIMPAFNEASIIGDVVSSVNQAFQTSPYSAEIVVVNDGSWDKTGSIARQRGAIVLCHPINRGLGGALSTGLEYARINSADITVSFDADGQHDTAFLPVLLEPLSLSYS